MAVRRPRTSLEIKMVVLKDLHHKINRKAMLQNIADMEWDEYSKFHNENDAVAAEAYERAFEETLHAHYGDELDYYIM